MTAKQELLKALLNTSNISKEAYSLLENIINGEQSNSGGNEKFEIRHTNEWQTDKTFKELKDAYEAGKTIVYITQGNTIEHLVSISMDNYMAYFSQNDYLYAIGEDDFLTMPD